MSAFRFGALRDLFARSDGATRKGAEAARPRLETLQEASRAAEEEEGVPAGASSTTDSEAATSDAMSDKTKEKLQRPG